MRVALQSASPADLETPLLVVPVYADEGARGGAFSAVDAKSGGRLAALLDEEGFKAKPGSSTLIHTPDQRFKRCLLVGVGKAADFAPTDARDLAALATKEANARNLATATVALPPEGDAGACVRFAAEGAILAGYRYDAWLTKDVDPLTCEAVTLTLEGLDTAGLAGTLARVQAACAGVQLARDLVNGPPVEVTPSYMAHVAKQIAEDEGLEIKVFKKKEIKARGMNLLSAVSAGSDEPPRFIHLTYRPENAGPDTPEVALVGKGLTYDAGGYNIKPTGSLEDMKIDMAGGAAVLGAMKAVSTWKPNCIVHGIVPSSENLINGSAYKPGDVIKSLNGKSVEIMNTDAEGRLILADALAYTEKLGVDRIVDLATLTGACMVALGPFTSALFANDDGWRGKVADAAERAGEDTWPMPLTKKLKSMLKSPIADLKNIGQRWGGAITAGIFLGEFVGDVTWAHLDIAGPAFIEKAEPSVPKGGTGYAVRLLLELVSGEI